MDIYAEIGKERLIHDGVLDRCETCHIIKEMSVGRVWEIDSHESLTRAAFFLKGLSLDRTYEVELKVRGPRKQESQVRVAAFKPYNVKVERYRNVPLIRNPRVDEIKQGIFIEAVVAWETDRPTVAAVEYGKTPGYGERIQSEMLFKTEHGVRISGLRGAGKYHWRIISRDVFGNISVSGDFTMDTEARFEKPAAQAVAKASPPGASVRLFRIDSSGDTCIDVESLSAVGLRLVVRETVELGHHGVGLAGGRDLRIKACESCHPRMVTHPVGISSWKADIEIPPEFPTIEGNVITCVTCHYPHGGGENYYARISLEKDLCEQCHRGGI
ncbi:MAG: hypothetical protein HY890_07155 [Deltaproteobacteria bacterium]|nr:hypothetical protein [Deltaproteobacteria bacterium]